VLYKGLYLDDHFSVILNNTSLGEYSMASVLREQGIGTIRDQVVSLVVQQWGKAFRDIATVSEWKETVGRGIPFYLFVPCGLKESIRKMAEDADV